MASPVGSQGTLRVQSDNQGSSITIDISEQAGLKAENLSLSTWGASFVLANLLHTFNIIHASRGSEAELDAASERPSVLEIGAGTGLVGLSAAAIWQTKVLLTDLAPIVPALAANVALNRSIFGQGSASCGALDWSRPEEIQVFPNGTAVGSRAISPTDFKADTILAADTIYSEEHPELLVSTILQWLSRSSRARVILCYPLRMAYIDHVREFWTLMEASGLECLDEGREAGNEDWNEVANTPYEWCIWSWTVQNLQSDGMV